MLFVGHFDHSGTITHEHFTLSSVLGRYVLVAAIDADGAREPSHADNPGNSFERESAGWHVSVRRFQAHYNEKCIVSYKSVHVPVGW